MAVWRREVQGHEHPQGYRPPVGEFVARGGFQAVAQGVPKIEESPLTLLPGICSHNGGLDTRGPADDLQKLPGLFKQPQALPAPGVLPAPGP